jgi:hypothetical protein
MTSISPEDFAKTFGDMEKSFYEPIGQYVFVFGRIERSIDKAVCDLMDVDYLQVGRYPLRELDFLTRVKLLLVYSRGAGEEIERRMKAAVLEMETQNTFRNNLVHGPWVGFMRGPGIEDNWQKPGLSRRFKSTFWNVTRSEIKANATKVKSVMTEISKVVDQILAARRKKIAAQTPSPGKS